MLRASLTSSEMVGTAPTPVAASTWALIRAGRNNAPLSREFATQQGEARRPEGMANYQYAR